MSEALAKKRKIQKYLGNVEVKIEHCKGCGFCVEFCPTGALELSKSFNKKGYHPPLVAKPADCVNCHYCESICPEFAIFSVEIPCSPDADRKDAA